MELAFQHEADGRIRADRLRQGYRLGWHRGSKGERHRSGDDEGKEPRRALRRSAALHGCGAERRDSGGNQPVLSKNKSHRVRDSRRSETIRSDRRDSQASSYKIIMGAACWLAARSDDAGGKTTQMVASHMSMSIHNWLLTKVPPWQGS